MFHSEVFAIINYMWFIFCTIYCNWCAHQHYVQVIFFFVKLASGQPILWKKNTNTDTTTHKGSHHGAGVASSPQVTGVVSSIPALHLSHHLILHGAVVAGLD